MKKLSFIILGFALACTQASGQSDYRPALKKGSVLMGGGLEISFGNSKSEYDGQGTPDESESKYTSFTLTPKAGFFVSDGLALGLSIDLTSTAHTYDDDSKETTTIYAVGPVIRYYTAAGLYFQAEVGFGKAIDKYTYEDDSEKDEANVIRWQTGIGYAFFLNDFIALEPNITYRSTIAKYEEDGVKFKGTLGEFVIGARIQHLFT